MCAEFCCDRESIFQTRALHILVEFWIWSKCQWDRRLKCHTRNDIAVEELLLNVVWFVMPPPLGAEALCFRVVRLSVRPSVQSPKYPLSTCTWVRWSIRPTVTVLRHICPSVRPERFPGNAEALCFRVVRLSVRPSVQSPKYPLSTCTWVRWSIRPTVTVLRHICPSVRPERFPGICQRTHGGNGLKFCMLMYRDHLQNWLDYGHGLSIFLLLAPLWLSEMG